ncbi:MAG: ABC transporter permease [Bacteroidaceae bacterium]|nr:ABC transporter permease [Bacteroidaceae bacterium]
MIRQFFRQALTMMRQHKLFTGMYIAGTAISIAMAMAIFIILYIKLGPIYPEYNRDRTVSMSLVYCQGEGENKTRLYGLASPIFLQKIREEAKHLDEMCIYKEKQFYDDEIVVTSVKSEAETDTYSFSRVDSKFWKVFDFNFIDGRPFTYQEEDKPLVIITSKIAKELFSKENVSGEDIYIDTVRYKIAGVVEEANTCIGTAYTNDHLWIPSQYKYDGYDHRDHIIGNDSPVMLATSPEATDSLINEIKDIFERLKQEQAGSKYSDYEIYLNKYWEDAFNLSSLQEGRKNSFFAAIAKYLYIILAFLLIPALNLSGMISSRMSSRMVEVGVRKAYGATDQSIIRQVLYENLLLTTIGAVIGLALSYLTMSVGYKWVMSIFDKGSDDIVSGVTTEMLFNPTIIIVVLLLTLVINIASALVPTIFALRSNIIEALYHKR